MLCELEIGTATWSQPLIAKVALQAGASGPCNELDKIRSYFVGSPDPPAGEYTALVALARHVDRLDDPRLFAVRVLDSLLDDQVLLMEKATARSLSHLLKSASRLHGGKPSPGLLEACRRAGSGLRIFHAMPVGRQRHDRGTTRQDFLAWLEANDQFVQHDPFSREFFHRICPEVRSAAGQLLPDQLPSGPLHDDFAPRNVLVDAAGRVALIDMLEEWIGCTWQDVAHFLVAIETNKLQSLSGGRLFPSATIQNLREAFLVGYYGDDAIPRAALAVFECQLALTKWAAAVHRLRTASGLRAVLDRRRLALSLRWYARYIERCLGLARQASTTGAPAAEAEPACSAGGAL
jgi:Ser/Thr protein kinase RdoA (MazF antagonist)